MFFIKSFVFSEKLCFFYEKFMFFITLFVRELVNLAIIGNSSIFTKTSIIV
jgi:hypothetical protein